MRSSKPPDFLISFSLVISFQNDVNVISKKNFRTLLFFPAQCGNVGQPSLR